MNADRQSVCTSYCTTLHCIGIITTATTFKQTITDVLEFTQCGVDIERIKLEKNRGNIHKIKQRQWNRKKVKQLLGKFKFMTKSNNICSELMPHNCCYLNMHISLLLLY